MTTLSTESPRSTTLKKNTNAFSLIAAPFTPMKADGSLHLQQIEPYAARLHRDGISAVFTGGTSGEGLSLTIAERLRLAESWQQAAQGRLQLIIHVGHTSTREAITLARHAASLPADAIAAIGPVFFTPARRESLIAYCQAIAEAAPQTPFYYYHMPSMSRVPFAASELLPQLAEKIPTFRGIKFTHEDLADYARCIELAGDRFEIFFGRDELLLKGIQLGARSAVGSTYNFAAPLYLRVAAAWRAGCHEEAVQLQGLCSRAVDIMVRYDGLVGIKATMSLTGLDCGVPRAPLAPLSPAQQHSLNSELEAIGFWNALSGKEAAPLSK